MQTGPGDRPIRKARRAKPKSQPSIVQAAADLAKKAEQSAPKPKRSKPPASLVTKLPSKPGQKPTVYKPTRLPKLERKIARANKRAAARASEVKDTKGDTERQRVERYKASQEYLDALKAAANARQKITDTSGPLRIDTASRNSITPRSTDKSTVDRPRTDAEMRKFLKTGERPVRKSQKQVALANTPGSVKLLKNAVNDYVDMNANAVPSTYHLAKTAVHDPGKALKEVAQPYKDVIKHPLRSFTEHPLQTALLVTGIKSLAGRSAGRALRTLPSKTTKRIASTERTAAVRPGTGLKQHRSYSPDLIDKGVQVTAEKARARRIVRKGERVPEKVMSGKDVRRRVDETVAASKLVSSKNAGDVQHAVRKAVGRKPDAAVSLTAQGIVNGTKADLRSYLGELETAAKDLKGPELKANLRARKDIRRALKNHNDAEVQAAARRYGQVAGRQEAEIVDRGLIDPNVAQSTRLAGVAVRRLGAQTGSEAKTAVIRSAKEQRDLAAKGASQARSQFEKADKQHSQAVADARVSVARVKTSPAVKAAEATRRAALAEVAHAKRALDVARRGHAKAQGRSEVLRRNIGGGMAGGRGIEIAKQSVDEAASRLRDARAAVKAAESRVAAERARVAGVAPREAEQLRSTIAQRDQAKQILSQARVDSKQARRAHIDTKRALKKEGAMVGPNGQIITVKQMRKALGNQPEPSFVTQEVGGARGRSALPTTRPAISDRGERSGEAIRRGTVNTRPEALQDQVTARQNLIDASKNYRDFVEEFGYRGAHDSPVQHYKTQELAANVGRQLEQDTGYRWQPVQYHGKVAVKNSKGQTTMKDRWALVPAEAADQLSKHANLPAQHPVLRAVGAQWRRNVLAFSPRWLTGNVVEAGLRSLIAGSGPRSYATGRKVLAELDRIDPEMAAKVRARTVGGGNYRAADEIAAARAGGEDLGRFAQAVKDFSQKPGPKQLGDLYEGYTNVVFRALNGRLETQFQTAMLGKALRDSPLMSTKTVKLSRQAVEDAAKGLTDTNAQVALGREVDRMYGQYGKFSPGVRQAISQYTPFAAWTINAVNFLTHVLPRDHPVLTSVLASATQTSKQWRKENDLVADFFKTIGTRPAWLQGSIPVKGGGSLRLSRYTPFGLFNAEGNSPLGSLPNLLLPQLSEITANLQGKDWQSQDLSKNPSGARDLAAAVASFLEGQVPAASQISSIAGVRLPNMRDSSKIEPGVGNRAKNTLYPFAATKGKQTGGKVTVSRSGSRGGLRPLPALKPLPPLPPPPRR